MSNNFFKKLVQVSRNEVNIDQPIPFDLKLLTEMLTKDFEIKQPIFITPLFGKKIKLAEEMVKFIQTEQVDHNIYFSVWGVTAPDSFYFLIGSDLQFFSKKQTNDPFRESDDFFKFATLLKSKLGFENIILYFSNDDYYFSIKKDQSKNYSFFLYKG